jgi:hypothetical protein
LADLSTGYLAAFLAFSDPGVRVGIRRSMQFTNLLERVQKSMSGARSLGLQGSDYRATLLPHRARRMWAFPVVNRQSLGYGVGVDLLFWDPTQGYDAGCQSFDWRIGVRGEADAPLDLALLKIHQNRLCHIVEVMTEGHDIGVDFLSHRIETLATEDSAI